ncbi:MAG: YlxR family protein [Acidobacteria bacterium]|nr:YlxR family protein [Acidobacteriota bacterium]
MGPVRTCVGCRVKRPQDELLRVIRRSDGTLEVGRTLPGRGAWLCPDEACLGLALRRRALERALRGDLSDGSVAAVRARMVETNRRA